MQKRQIGNSQLSVAPLAFGGNVFGWTVDEPTSFKLLDAFVDAGLDLIDTADVYSVWQKGSSGGESETIIGRWLKKSGKRDKVVIATKCGMKMAPTLGSESLSKAYILKAVESSLKRLQIDTIDLYQSHKDDPNTPVEETMDAFAQLVKEGKVRVLGASNFEPKRLQESLDVSRQKGIPRYECMQPEYNLYDREDYERNLAPLCVRENIAVISYFSLARGFLSGKYRSTEDLQQSARGEGVKKYMNERGFRIIDALHTVAAELKSNPAQVSLAWLIAKPSVTAPIASATTIEQLNDLIEAVRLELSDEMVKLLDDASAYEVAIPHNG